MNEPSQSLTQRRVLTPLWIIALFISLTETVLGVGVIKTSGGIQIALTVFVLSFPLLIAGTFFFTLWKKPWVLYAPMEYGKETNVKDFVHEMSGRTRSLEELQIYTQIQQSIRDVLVSPDVISELSKITQRGEYTAHGTVKSILSDAATKTEENIRKQAFLTIDSRSFENDKGHIWQVPYDNYTRVSDLLDDLYFTLNERNRSFPAFAFGKLWALRDVESGRIFKDMGRLWAKRQGEELDERGLAQVGLRPGMTLECFWL
jgi:hypothetical protein